MKISIYGSAAPDMDPKVIEIGRRLGAEIARRGHTVITGACPGIPHEVAQAAHQAGGTVIGYSPAFNKEQHIRDGMPAEGYTELKFLPKEMESRRIEARYKLRNIDSVEACDAAIFISGRVGTLNEYTLAYDLLKPFGALLGSGGAADALEEIAKKVPKKPQPFMCFSPDYLEILDALERATAIQAE
jgi:predicted Rossmann-fold nucleotide-binding protein